MRIVSIPKRNGSYRQVCVPTEDEKKQLRELLPDLNKMQSTLCNESVHGFMPLRSAVTNAKAHIGKKYTLCFDLKDFFDTVTREKAASITSAFYDHKYDICFVDNIARQGLPTSPAIANIAAIRLDALCGVQLRRLDMGVVYTRYADDLTISFDDESLVDRIKELVKMYVEECGFALAEHKTSLYSAAGGFRKITGVSVGETDVRPTRESKRKLRAALHQNNTASARGLEEWQKLKTPPDPNTTFSRICTEFKIPVVTPPAKVVSNAPFYASGVITYNSPEAILAAAHVCYGRPSKLLLGNNGRGLLNWALDPHVCLVGKDGWSSRVSVGAVTISNINRMTSVCLGMLTEHGLVVFAPLNRNRQGRWLLNSLRRVNVKVALSDYELRGRTDMTGLKEITVEMRREIRPFYRPSGVIVKANKNKLTLRFYVEEN